MDTLPIELRPVAEWIINNWVLCASLLGNGVLGLLYYLQWRETRKLRQIEQDREDRRKTTEQSADLVARFRSTARSPRLRIVNKGKSKAQNVHVYADGIPVKEYRGFDGGEKHPIPTLAPDGDLEYMYGSDRGSPSNLEITLQWDDESGGGTWTSTLKVA